MEYYIDGVPMNMVVRAEHKIEKMLYDEENRLQAGGIIGKPAYITLNMKNGKTFYVAREKRFNNYHIQILDNQLKVVASASYNADFRFGLTSIAAKCVRLGAQKK